MKCKSFECKLSQPLPSSWHRAYLPPLLVSISHKIGSKLALKYVGPWAIVYCLILNYSFCCSRNRLFLQNKRNPQMRTPNRSSKVAIANFRWGYILTAVIPVSQFSVCDTVIVMFCLYIMCVDRQRNYVVTLWLLPTSLDSLAIA